MPDGAHEVVLETSRLTRRFGGVAAVADVSISIATGELVGLIGPNGAGKTTLFNLISGYTQPSSGTIRFRGRSTGGLDVAEIARMGVSRTFQNLRVFPTMTVFDNVSVGAVGSLGFPWWRAFHSGGADHRAEAISLRTQAALEETGLTEAAETLASALSYGQRKYLEVARALATDPILLFLDEPAAGLNDTETAELNILIKSLNKRGVTIIVVEHNVGFIISLCDRVICLAAGQVIADGSPGEVARSADVRRQYLGEFNDHA